MPIQMLTNRTAQDLLSATFTSMPPPNLPAATPDIFAFATEPFKKFEANPPLAAGMCGIAGLDAEISERTAVGPYEGISGWTIAGTVALFGLALGSLFYFGWRLKRVGESEAGKPGSSASEKPPRLGAMVKQDVRTFFLMDEPPAAGKAAPPAGVADLEAAARRNVEAFFSTGEAGKVGPSALEPRSPTGQLVRDITGFGKINLSDPSASSPPFQGTDFFDKLFKPLTTARVKFPGQDTFIASVKRLLGISGGDTINSAMEVFQTATSPSLLGNPATTQSLPQRAGSIQPLSMMRLQPPVDLTVEVIKLPQRDYYLSEGDGSHVIDDFEIFQSDSLIVISQIYDQDGNLVAEDQREKGREYTQYEVRFYYDDLNRLTHATLRKRTITFASANAVANLMSNQLLTDITDEVVNWLQLDGPVGSTTGSSSAGKIGSTGQTEIPANALNPDFLGDKGEMRTFQTRKELERFLRDKGYEGEETEENEARMLRNHPSGRFMAVVPQMDGGMIYEVWPAVAFDKDGNPADANALDEEVNSYEYRIRYSFSRDGSLNGWDIRRVEIQNDGVVVTEVNATTVSSSGDPIRTLPAVDLADFKRDFPSLKSKYPHAADERLEELVISASREWYELPLEARRAEAARYDLPDTLNEESLLYPWVIEAVEKRLQAETPAVTGRMSYEQMQFRGSITEATENFRRGDLVGAFNAFARLAYRIEELPELFNDTPVARTLKRLAAAAHEAAGDMAELDDNPKSSHYKEALKLTTRALPREALDIAARTAEVGQEGGRQAIHDIWAEMGPDWLFRDPLAALEGGTITAEEMARPAVDMSPPMFDGVSARVRTEEMLRTRRAILDAHRRACEAAKRGRER